jgi:hypothetical protein
MQPPPPPTPFEVNVSQAYQMLGQGRMQSALLNHSMVQCIPKCLDTEELYTLLRTTQAPIKYRLEKDLAEKKCVENCGAKWDELYRRAVMKLNQQETSRVQTVAMQRMMESMQGQHQSA